MTKPTESQPTDTPAEAGAVPQSAADAAKANPGIDVDPQAPVADPATVEALKEGDTDEDDGPVAPMGGDETAADGYEPQKLSSGTRQAKEWIARAANSEDYFMTEHRVKELLPGVGTGGTLVSIFRVLKNGETGGQLINPTLRITEYPVVQIGPGLGD